MQCVNDDCSIEPCNLLRLGSRNHYVLHYANVSFTELYQQSSVCVVYAIITRSRDLAWMQLDEEDVMGCTEFVWCYCVFNKDNSHAPVTDATQVSWQAVFPMKEYLFQGVPVQELRLPIDDRDSRSQPLWTYCCTFGEYSLSGRFIQNSYE